WNDIGGDVVFTGPIAETRRSAGKSLPEHGQESAQHQVAALQRSYRRGVVHGILSRVGLFGRKGDRAVQRTGDRGIGRAWRDAELGAGLGYSHRRARGDTSRQWRPNLGAGNRARDRVRGSGFNELAEVIAGRVPADPEIGAE